MEMRTVLGLVLLFIKVKNSKRVRTTASLFHYLPSVVLLFLKTNRHLLRVDACWILLTVTNPNDWYKGNHFFSSCNIGLNFFDLVNSSSDDIQ